MTYCYFFQMLGNLSLFYFVANSFLYVFQLKISLFPTILLALACSLGFFLNQKKPKLRYLSIIFMPLAFAQKTFSIRVFRLVTKNDLSFFICSLKCWLSAFSPLRFLMFSTRFISQILWQRN